MTKILVYYIAWIGEYWVLIWNRWSNVVKQLTEVECFFPGRLFFCEVLVASQNHPSGIRIQPIQKTRLHLRQSQKVNLLRCMKIVHSHLRHVAFISLFAKSKVTVSCKELGGTFSCRIKSRQVLPKLCFKSFSRPFVVNLTPNWCLQWPIGSYKWLVLASKPK